MNFKCEVDESNNKFTIRNGSVHARLRNLVIQASAESGAGNAASTVVSHKFRPQVIQAIAESGAGNAASTVVSQKFRPQENQHRISKETIEELKKKSKELEGDYLKMKKLNEERLQKVLALKLDPRRCICNRPTTCVLCIACGYLGKGRKATNCNIHPKTKYLSDMDRCPKCLSENYLLEKDVSPKARELLSAKNTNRSF